jgi:hypothetical protein
VRKSDIDALFNELDDARYRELEGKYKQAKSNIVDLTKALQKAKRLWASTYTHIPVPKKKKASRTYNIRIAAGDLHGSDQHVGARNAFLRDVAILNPDEIVLLGDIINCAGTFSKWHRVHISEHSYTYENDIAAGNDFLDELKKAAPRATIYYIQGNHEARVNKWAAANFEERYLAQMAIDAFGERSALHLDARGISYFANDECHMGLYKPGIIILGKCGFMHGYGGGKHVAEKHLIDVGMNIVHGHNHREQSHTIRTAKDPALRGMCPGCLCILQQYYNHERPTDHTHGYTLQFEDPKSLWFSSSNIAILEDRSLLHLVNIK